MKDYIPLFFAVEFEEYSIIKNFGESKYTITQKNLTDIKDKYRFNYDYEAYCMILMTRISELNKYERLAFINYQLSQVVDKIKWFYTLQDCFEKAIQKSDAINPWPNMLYGMSEIMDQIYSEIKILHLKTEVPIPAPDPTKKDFIALQKDFRDEKKDILPYSKIIKTPSRFSRFEEGLHSNGYIDAKYNYIHNHGAKNELAFIYLHLINKNYFNKRQFPGNKEIKDVVIRKFLDHRYQTDIDKQFRTYRKNPNAVAEFVDSHYWLDQIPSC